jgi:hypothetical protein
VGSCAACVSQATGDRRHIRRSKTFAPPPVLCRLTPVACCFMGPSFATRGVCSAIAPAPTSFLPWRAALVRRVRRRRVARAPREAR